MFFAVCVRRDGPSHYKAIVPDLPACAVSSESKARVLTDIHLAIEAKIAELLGKKETLPRPRLIEELQVDNDYSDGELFAIHINLDHLQAVALHQTGNWR